MDTDITQNPFLNDDLRAAPFAGRQAEFSRLYQHLTDPARIHAMLVVGRENIGKTAFLHQFSAVFDDSFVGVYVPLKEVFLKHESGWLMTLVHACTEALSQRDFTLTRLSEPPVEENKLRDWLRDTRLHEVCTIIRPHRRVILLLDDIHTLIEAVVVGKLPIDTFAYIQSLLDQHPQIGLVLTINTQHESNLDAMSPLVSAATVIRLSGLTPDEGAHLLAPQNLYTLDEKAVIAAHRATGGQPELLQRLGFLLFHYWQSNPEYTLIGEDAIKELVPRVYIESEEVFKQIWQGLDRTERLVLTAITSRLYDDPLRKIDTTAIEAWLVETDYPLDTIAINTAIRGLEYAEIITAKPDGIAINAGLMQKWLLENARLSEPSSTTPTPTRRIWIVLAILVIIVVITLIYFALTIPRSDTIVPIVPTIPLG